MNDEVFALVAAQREEEEVEEEVRRRGGDLRRDADWIRRDTLGWYENLMLQLEEEDPNEFKAMLRMEPAMFHELQARLFDRLKKKDTNWRRALPPRLKIAITLTYLGSGHRYKTLMRCFRVPSNTISLIITEVCQAIIDEYRDEMIQCPSTSEEWKEKAEEFGVRWNFGHALGALDVKHLAARKPRNSGSMFRNSEGFFSFIIMALVDARYRFMWVEVGAGAGSDAQIYNSSQLKKKIEDGSMGFPEPDNLPAVLPHRRRCICPPHHHDEAVLPTRYNARGENLQLPVFQGEAGCSERLRDVGKQIPVPPG